MKKETKNDLIFAIALVVGAIVLAVVSWVLPSAIETPMDATMRGTVEEVYPSYQDTRVSIKLEGNSVKFTMPIDTFKALENPPEIGDYVRMKYELSQYRDIHLLKIQQADGDYLTVLEAPNPALERLYTYQAIAFALYGLYALICVVIFRKKAKK